MIMQVSFNKISDRIVEIGLIDDDNYTHTYEYNLDIGYRDISEMWVRTCNTIIGDLEIYPSQNLIVIEGKKHTNNNMNKIGEFLKYCCDNDIKSRSIILEV